MAIIRTKDYRSDIVLTLHMTLGGETVNVPQHDFLLRFFTEHEARHYDCGRIKGEWLHCAPDESDTTLLTCYIKNHGLGCGMLQCLYIDLSPNDGMEDGVQRTFSVSGIDLELVDDASDDTQAVDGSVIVDINAVLTELEGLQVDLTDAIAAAEAATASANSAASTAASSAMSANTAAVRANTAASDATSAASAANDAASSALQSQQKNINSIVYIGATGDGAANTVLITLNDGTRVTGSVFNGHTGTKGEDGVSVVFGSLNNGIFYDRDGREAVRSADLLYVSISDGKIYRWGTNSYVYLGMTVDPQPTAGSSNLVSSGGVAAALEANDKVVFYFDVNGTKYVAEKHWNERVQDWDYVASDVVVVVEPSKIYVDCTTNYMYVSPWVGAWIKLNEISAREYDNGAKVNEVSIAPTGVISKMASNVTKTYDLPAESGTLALASDIASARPMRVTATWDASASYYTYESAVDVDTMYQSFYSQGKVLELHLVNGNYNGLVLTCHGGYTSNNERHLKFSGSGDGKLIEADVVGTAVTVSYEDINAISRALYGKQDKTLMTSTIPANGLLPNVVYDYGTTDSVSVTLAAGETGVANIWCFVFTAQTAACTVTLPSGVVLGNEYAWDMVAGRRYEVSIMDNVAIVNFSD